MNNCHARNLRKLSNMDAPVRVNASDAATRASPGRIKSLMDLFLVEIDCTFNSRINFRWLIPLSGQNLNNSTQITFRWIITLKNNTRKWISFPWWRSRGYANQTCFYWTILVVHSQILIQQYPVKIYTVLLTPKSLDFNIHKRIMDICFTFYNNSNSILKFITSLLIKTFPMFPGILQARDIEHNLSSFIIYQDH